MPEEKEKLTDENLEAVVGGTGTSPVEPDFTPADTSLGLNREKVRLSGETTAAKYDKKIDSLR